MEYMDLLPPTAPSLVFARETCTPYCVTRPPQDMCGRFVNYCTVEVVRGYVTQDHQYVSTHHEGDSRSDQQPMQ